jgi:hypothetical protein
VLYMFMSRHKSDGHDHNLRTVNNFVKTVAEIGHLGRH